MRRPARRLPNLEARQQYERLITPLRAVAARHGYALAVHGTLARDIDLIAAPWTVEASTPAALVEAIRAETESVTGRRTFWVDDLKADSRDYTRRNPEPKPHGRLAWSLYMSGRSTYIDLSVMPIGGPLCAYPQYHERIGDQPV